MDHFVDIGGATLFADASSLIETHGAGARDEAGKRALLSRSDGNIVRFCRWRDVRRLVTVLAAGESSGTLH